MTRFLFVGRPRPEKGLAVLADAWRAAELPPDARGARAGGDRPEPRRDRPGWPPAPGRRGHARPGRSRPGRAAQRLRGVRRARAAVDRDAHVSRAVGPGSQRGDEPRPAGDRQRRRGRGGGRPGARRATTGWSCRRATAARWRTRSCAWPTTGACARVSGAAGARDVRCVYATTPGQRASRRRSRASASPGGVGSVASLKYANRVRRLAARARRRAARPARRSGERGHRRERSSNVARTARSLGGFSQKDYRRALQELPTEVEEYSDCANLIRHAQLARPGTAAGAVAAEVRQRRPHRSRRPSAARWRARPSRGGAVQGRRSARQPGRRPRRHRLGAQLAAGPAAGNAGLPARLRGRAGRALDPQTGSAPTAPTEPRPAVLTPSPPAGATAGAGATGDPATPGSPPPVGAPASANGTRLGGVRSGWQSALSARAQAWWPTVLIAGVLCFVAFCAGGGLNLATMTTVEIALTRRLGADRRRGGSLRPGARASIRRWAVALLLAFAALTALSVVWSVQPDDSFKDAGRMLAYCGVFGAAVALARAVPARWPAVLGGVVLAAVVVCGYALLDEGLPGVARRGRRLRAPACAVRLLERDRPDGGDGRDRLHVAGRPAHRACAAQRACLPGDGVDAADADARLLARRAGGARARPGAVVLHRAAAPARCGGADQRCGLRGRRRGVGLLQTCAEQRQRGARGTHERGPPARAC